MTSDYHRDQGQGLCYDYVEGLVGMLENRRPFFLFFLNSVVESSIFLKLSFCTPTGFWLL
jgi:hypothetical protein